MGGLRLLRRRHKAMTIWIFRPSSAARPPDLVTILTSKTAPVETAGALFFATICIVL
jgi:hypothetical protein